ncbi:hypothetical protein OROGR_009932 [Orobanche gracilis]
MKYNEICHFSHPHHYLKFEYSEAPFKCDGCKEAGIGSRYRCCGGSGGGGEKYDGGACNFDLHVHCAIPSPSITHPFYTKCSFQFLSRPPGPEARYCNACKKDVAGFVYHCGLCGFDLHPCCAKLPMVLDDDQIKLFLYKKTSAPCHRFAVQIGYSKGEISNNLKANYSIIHVGNLQCGRKGMSWSYRSSCKKYNLHVACVREILVESWHELYYGALGNRYTGNRRSETGIPSLRSTLQAHNHKKSKGKAQKCCEMAGLALQFVISAVLGDPTTLITALVGKFMSK